MTFLTRYWLALLAVVGAVVVGAVKIHDNHIRDQTTLERNVAEAKTASATAEKKLAHADTALVHDTVVVTRTLHAYHRLRDTLNVHDTVQVRMFVAVADSSARACTELVSSCARFRLTADSTIAALHSQIRATERLADFRKPGFFARITPKPGFGCTAGLNPVSGRPGGVCGLSLGWRF